MRANFSEFQFAYSVTKAIDECNIWTSGPFFPTQRQEADFGFDVAFPDSFFPLFLQFKRTQLLTNDKAKEWPYWRRNYYRFKIYPDEHSSQHNSLVDLAHFTPRFTVGYCAPLFVSLDKMMGYHREHTILENSVFIDCAHLSYITDNKTHCFCFVDEPDLTGEMFSEPKNIKICRTSEIKYKNHFVYSNYSEFINDMYIFLQKEEEFRNYMQINDDLMLKNNIERYIYAYMIYTGINLMFIGA